jgi:hypothetical protein
MCRNNHQYQTPYCDIFAPVSCQVIFLPVPVLTLRSAYRESGFILKYCSEHASDIVNPVQDLIDKGIVTPGWFD